jgi:O-succinylbenzoic acid--CoA ligase
VSDIRCPLYEAALISRHEPAIVSGSHTMLYHELDEYAGRVARNAADAGVQAGDRVALFLPSGWQYVAIFFGLLRIGAVACPLNTRLPRAAVLEYVRAIRCRHVVAKVAAGGRGDLEGVRVLDPDDLGIYRSELESPPEWRLSMEAPATILFTSGSGGHPKAVQHRYAHHYYSARGANQNIRLVSHDAWLLALPLYHVGGLSIVFRTLLAGATLAIPEGDESIEQAQERYGVTHLSLVSTQLIRLLQSANLPPTFGSLKAIVLGGSAIAPAHLAEAIRRTWPVYPSYGLTEMASQVATVQPSSPPAKRMTSGRVLHHRELRIGAGGEIQVRGATRFDGYVRPDGLETPFDAEGWFSTGDVGALDAEGYLTVQGRRDNLFISGGENIQPEEIERLLGSLPEVAEAIVVPVAHAEFGERPVAYVRWNGQPLSLAAVRERLAQVLPKYKLPDAVRPWPEDAGALKVNRAELKRRAREEPSHA